MMQICCCSSGTSSSSSSPSIHSALPGRGAARGPRNSPQTNQNRLPPRSDRSATPRWFTGAGAGVDQAGGQAGGKPGAGAGRRQGTGSQPGNPPRRRGDGGGRDGTEAGADRVPAAAGGPEQPRQGRRKRGPAQGVAGREGAPGAGCRRKVEAGLAPAVASIFFLAEKEKRPRSASSASSLARPPMSGTACWGPGRRWRSPWGNWD